MKVREQNGQKFEDIKGLIRRHKSMKDREHNGQKFEDTKGVIRTHKSIKDREQNGQKFEDTKGVNKRHKSMKEREHIQLHVKMKKIYVCYLPYWILLESPAKYLTFGIFSTLVKI
jgi:hypothetical protein